MTVGPTTAQNAVETDYRRLAKGEYRDGRKTRIVFFVSTVDFDRGKGDLFVAAGLGRYLHRLGHGVELVPQSRWYEADLQDAVGVAMLPNFEPMNLPMGSRLVAWVRNCTRKWAKSVDLSHFAMILASSRQSMAFLEKEFSGQIHFMPLAVDAELFNGNPRDRRTIRALSTSNHWGTDRRVHEVIKLAKSREIVHWYGADQSSNPKLADLNRGAIGYFDVPELYGDSELIIDDVNDVSVEFGNHNSRLFEGLAAGALVVTNTSLGLSDLGLEAVPTYRSVEELLSMVLEPSDDGHIKLARSLQKTILQQHTFEVRAADFSERIKSVSAPAESPADDHTLVFLPDYRSANPFQDVLYAGLPDNVRVRPVWDRFSFMPVSKTRQLDRWVLHVHWQNVITQSSPDLVAATRRLEWFKKDVTEFKSRGGRLIWTIHNALPHEYSHLIHELELCQFLADNADVVHVLSEETLAICSRYYQLDPAKCVVVQHSTFAGIYPELLDRSTARRKFGITPDERVVLLFGGLRPYKGLGTLLSAIDEVVYDDPTVRFLIAGRPGATLSDDTLDELRAHPNVILHDTFIDDASVHAYFRASDVQVLPYHKVLNSGSVMLGIGYSLPVVVPSIGALQEFDESPFAFSFEPGNSVSLANALHSALRASSNESVADALREFAESRSPDRMSDDFKQQVWDVLVGDPAAASVPLSR